MDASGEKLVIGAFRPFGGKRTNQAAEVAARLEKMKSEGTLQVPDHVEISFLPLDTTVEGVEKFVARAKELKADKVLMLGENGLSLKVEAQAFDRGRPSSLLVSAASELVPSFRKSPSLETKAPAEAMAGASRSALSRDPGSYYCNYSYFTALSAGLNAVFVHVPSGIFGFGRDPDAAALGVNDMLGTWYAASAQGPLVME